MERLVISQNESIDKQTDHLANDLDFLNSINSQALRAHVGLE